MHERRRLGAEGEARAAAWLERAGYRIVARNVRADGVEIDLVVRRGTLIAFVEVKTRRGRGYGAGEEAVDARKRARLRHGAVAWLHEHGRGNSRVRFDVVVCEPSARGTWRIRHLPAAFED